jgi:uncharacterized protein YbaP (TraB family)
MLKSILRRGLGLFGLAALAGCLAPVEARQAAKPALWQVSDADTTIYVFGTIHLLPAGTEWQTPALEKAVREAQSLVVETIVDEKNPQAFMTAMSQLGFSPGQPPIAERVPAAKRAALAAAIAKSGVPREVFDRMETWAAAFTLLGVQFRELGLIGSEGVETVLRQQFTSSGKPIGELESNTEQLRIFDSLSEKDQRSFLEGVMEEPQAMRKQFKQMLEAWVRGDIDGIAQSFNQDLSSTPAMENALIRNRNARWRTWVEQRLASPGTVLLAVGAGHLAGKDSLLTMLSKDGYKVRRVQ